MQPSRYKWLQDVNIDYDQDVAVRFGILLALYGSTRSVAGWLVVLWPVALSFACVNAMAFHVQCQMHCVFWLGLRCVFVQIGLASACYSHVSNGTRAKRNRLINFEIIYDSAYRISFTIHWMHQGIGASREHRRR